MGNEKACTNGSMKVANCNQHNNYKNDKAHGLSETLHLHAALLNRTNFIERRHDGLLEEFEIKGKLIKAETWRNGALTKENQSD